MEKQSIPTQLNIAPRGKTWKNWQLVDGEDGFKTREAMEKFLCNPERVRELEECRRLNLETIERLNALLAVGQQGVQPFGYVNTYTGQFFKDVEPCRKHNEGHWRTVYTHPTQQGLDAQDMYYLQDARWSAMVGNCPSFWREGGNGYTTNIDEAGRFTFEEAMAQHRCRETDLPWLCAEVDKLRRPTIDCQYLPRSWDEQRAALAAQAKQAEALQTARDGGCGCCGNACADRADGCRFVHENPSAADMAAAQAKQGEQANG